MPRELVSISNFANGIIGSIDAENIPNDAASFSLDVDNNTTPGILSGRYADKGVSTNAYTANMQNAVSIENIDGTYDIIGVGNNKATLVKDFYGTVPTISEITGVTAGDTHIISNGTTARIANKNGTQWYGKISKTIFNSDDTNYQLENSELANTNVVKSFHKVVACTANGIKYYYAIEWRGQHLYKYSEDFTLIKIEYNIFISSVALATCNAGFIYVVDDTSTLKPIYKINAYSLAIDTTTYISGFGDAGVYYTISDICYVNGYLWFSRYFEEGALYFTLDDQNAIFRYETVLLTDDSSVILHNQTPRLKSNAATTQGWTLEAISNVIRTKSASNLPTNVGLWSFASKLPLAQNSTNNGIYVIIDFKYNILAGSTEGIRLIGSMLPPNYYGYRLSGYYVLNISNDMSNDARIGLYSTVLGIAKLETTSGITLPAVTCIVNGTQTYFQTNDYMYGINNANLTVSTLSTSGADRWNFANAMAVYTTASGVFSYFSDTANTNNRRFLLQGESTYLFTFYCGTSPSIKRHSYTGGEWSSYYVYQSLFIISKNIDVSGTGFTAGQKYYYTYSLVYDNFQESPLALQDEYLNVVPGASNLVTITIDVSDPNKVPDRVTSIRIYSAQSTSGATQPQTFFRLVKELGFDESWPSNRRTFIDYGNYGASYESNSGLPQTLSHSHVDYSICTTYQGYLFVADCTVEGIKAEESCKMVIRSKQDCWDSFDWTNDFVVVPHKPLAIQAFQGYIFVFTDNQIYRINPAGMYIEDIYQGIGINNKDSVCVTEYGMFFCDANNFYMHDGKAPIPIGDVTKYIVSAGDVASTYGWVHLNEEVGARTFVLPMLKHNSILFGVSYQDTTQKNIFHVYNVSAKRVDIWGVTDAVLGNTGGFVGKNSEVYISSGSIAGYYLHEVCGAAIRKTPLWYSKEFTLDQPTQLKKVYDIKYLGTAGGMFLFRGDATGNFYDPLGDSPYRDGYLLQDNMSFFLQELDSNDFGGGILLDTHQEYPITCKSFMIVYVGYNTSNLIGIDVIARKLIGYR